jgi:hypothetical protein
LAAGREILGAADFCCWTMGKIRDPVSHEGRGVYASAEALNGWLGQESAGEPGQLMNENTDLSAELKRWLSHVRKQSRSRTPRRERLRRMNVLRLLVVLAQLVTPALFQASNPPRIATRSGTRVPEFSAPNWR